METYMLNNDIEVFYIAAASFPDGIPAAFEKLHSIVPQHDKRTYYGVSRPERDNIVYRAATPELKPGELQPLKLDSLVLKKGRYASVDVKDYSKDLPAIGRTFDSILQRPDIDPQGYCVEWYDGGKDVKCMVRLAE